MNNKGITIEATFGFLLLGILIVSFGILAFRIPGFLGQLFGLLNFAFFTIADTIWNMIGQILLPIKNEIRKILVFSIAMPLTFAAIKIGQFAVAKIIAWNAARTAAAAGIEYIGPATQLSLKTILKSAVTGIKTFAKGAIVGAAIELLVSAGLNYLGVPQAIDNWAGGPVKFQTPLGEGSWSWGSATTGAISGAAGGAAFGAIAAPFTFGLSVAVGAGIGALVGFITGGLFG